MLLKWTEEEMAAIADAAEQTSTTKAGLVYRIARKFMERKLDIEFEPRRYYARRAE